MKKIFLSIMILAGAGKYYGQNCSVNANIDQTVCVTGGLQLSGASGGLFNTTANWIQVSGPAVSISSPNSLTTAVTGYLGGNVYKFRLQAKCQDGSNIFDEINVTVLPNTLANAGADLPASCPGTKTLSANSVGSGETGVWTIQGSNNAGVTITSPNSPTTQIVLGTSSTGSTTLRWTITNSNGCTNFDQMVVSNYGGNPTVTAGSNQTLSNCYSATQSTNLNGSFGGNGFGGQSGTWSMISGPNYPTISNSGSSSTGISNLIQGTYVFKWLVTGGCASGQGTVSVLVPAATQNVTSVSANGQSFCTSASVAVISANPPTYANEVLTWVQTGGPAATITNSNSASTAVTGLIPPNAYTFSASIVNTLTGCNTSAVANINYVLTPPAVSMPADVLGTCGQTLFTIPFTATGGSSTSYKVLSGPGGPSGFNSTGNPLSLTYTVPGTYYLQVKQSAGGIGCSSASDDINITVSKNPSLSNAGTSQNLACGVLSTTLSGNNPASGDGTWYQISGPNTAVIANPTLNVTTITGLTAGTYFFRWSISGGLGCSTNFADTRVVVANPAPTAASAGPSQTVCYGTQIQLAGNTPTVIGETGTWSVTPSAGVSIASSTNPVTIVTGLSASTSYTFTWKISNACGSSTSNVVYTTTSGQGPTIPNAGTDKCLGTVTSVNLTGNSPSVGTGTWSTVSGPNVPSITSPNTGNTSVTGLTTGTYYFLWSIGTGTCSVAKDTIAVTVNNSTSASNAGSNMSVCATATALSGNTPAVGVGTWSQFSGPGGVTIANPTLATSAISGLTNNGIYVFVWTISNGACSTNTSSVKVLSNVPPTAANAGPSQTICGTSANLAGNAPSLGTGIWSQTGLSANSPQITSPTLSNTSVSGFNTGVYNFNWSISSGPLCPASVSSVNINVSAPANAGSDINLCYGTNAQLVGTPGSNGTWALISGPSSPATTTNSGYSSVVVSNMLSGTYVYEYTAPSLYGCAATTDQVNIIVSPYGTTPDAGADQSICLASTNSITLAGNTPTVGTGLWSLLTGPSGNVASITSASSPSSNVTGLTVPGVYVFNWNISNGNCSSFSDVVRIQVDLAPSTASAGATQTNACATNFSLAANQPTSGIGVWTQSSGPSTAVFDSPNQPNPAVTGLSAGTYQFVWTISTGTACPPSSSTVSITFPTVPPTNPLGGSDLNLCQASSTVLAGNTISTGTSTWTSIAGPNTPTFSNANSPTSNIGNLVAGPYTLLWTASNGGCLVRDTVLVVNSAQPNTANAGPSQTICPFTSLILSGNTPTAGTTGLWSYISGPGTPVILTPSAVTTTVLGTSVGSYVFRWTISSLNCAPSISNVTVEVNSACPTTISDATVTAANVPVSGDASINDLAVTGGTYAITGQPANGTVTINPSTGQYTFTPAANFSGVTQATYNLCNGTPSVSCSTATITFTVYPAIVSNSDIVTTTPSVTTTGSLTTNDTGYSAGVSAGATYSISVTQPATSTGTITVNPSTGQYTFVPNPSFTGTAQTTYTICNTAVTPVVCSNTVIVIRVGATPTAVADASTTVINTAITGSVGTNDSGNIAALSPVYTAGTLSASTGTLTMNPTTGQYTYTPASGFTGTTSTTYTLCNVLSPPCSTTTITFTVFPAIASNSDIISTTPSVTSTGTLTTNDTGVSAGLALGATYSVSVTQPAASTGTITVNPATGQYTFVPNATFAGTASTTYTICNTSVNPVVCSNTTILIQVGVVPTAVADFSTTVINTPVAGNLGTNDAGASAALSPVFTAGTLSPGTGTLTVNPTTGAYTFTPATGFTGTTSTTYTLCNVLSPPCSTTTITFTVLPAIVSNSDIIATTPSVNVSGTLTINDTGVSAGLALGATYSVTVTQPAPSVGTININPATGQYTFVPNPAFTGTSSTTYTICNTAVNPVVCSNTTILIQVGNFPNAAPDFTNTPINTPVSGNAAANDNGTLTALSPTFTAGQPSPGTGTLVMNPSTGQYTYTPASGFTGTTTATYTLCNTLQSSSCPTTTITFSVYPNIAANTDIINTAPSVSVTGNIYTNDTGVLTSGTLTAVYSGTVTQPSSTTGTITFNAATGQYTFIPNPAFAGTTQTTYTVCNVSVNPTICSTSTITINVKPNPVPVNDATTTVVNTTVSGNAAANDTGTITGTYSIIGQPANGTISINATTGVYTFTPATSFTGVTTATYNLCNGAPVTCSTAIITITVYPALQANNDVIATTPSVTATGSLATNDLGIVSGGTYSFSVTQPSPAVGTITIDPATGQYTFVPNPSFTGTTLTTYTVCNTSVNPVVCSNTTILIQVGSFPLASSDFSNTPMNTPVTGNVSSNDVGASPVLSPVFTAGTLSPGTGTLTMNPSTGQYTYTPAPGFTGTTTATYTLCNVLSPPCSTTTITFSVYPSIGTNSDVVITTPSVSVTGSLLANDLGIVTSGTLIANYSVTVTQPSPSVGVIVFNASTGQYTFTPNPSFTGSVQTTYTVCNTSVNPVICSNTVIVIYVGDLPLASPDNTATPQGVAVTGNAAGNDAGANPALSPVFTSGTLAATQGTFAMDPATGQYTFTPNPGFTGTTSVTYTLCNLLSPPCSTTTITFTVFPTLTASVDVLTTTSTSTLGGNLLSNDNGITTGGTYTVSVTPLNPATGTLVINPTTGQYTFIPNPGFTGTTSTTYTVCNTAVNPSVCSTSTIILNVGSFPAAVSDGTITMQGVAVNGNASTNDVGAEPALNPVFTVGAINPSQGSIIMDPATGQYTFTPGAGFTGTTSVNYTLCNVLSPPCSTTTITFTVLPSLQANNNVVSTSPSVSTTGNLLQNDLGITTGGVYSVTVTQPSSSTGTLLVDPATGNYTFTPNPGFTGTVNTTYTVCNTAVNPVVCSSATITIIVNSLAVAVADGTITPQGVAVSGNAGANDAGANAGLNPVFTVGTLPAGTGSITMNPATGQYTYTPDPGFTGTTSVNYTLCNVNSPPCSTTTITFTVFPNIAANPDIIATTPSVTVTGNILSNDPGVTSGGIYSVVVTQPPASTGTLIVNQSTGQYTFIPNPNFTGTTVTTYTVCNTAVTPVVCSNSTITIIVGNGPIANSDATLTPQGVAVSGNAASNDNGVLASLNPTFTVGSMTSSVGTIAMDPATGHYTFTPHPGFTGTTSVTYVLCNSASPPCATTTINFTVFPTLVANPTVIVTSPTLSVGGNLTINGGSLTPGGSYNFTVTQPASSTGTILLNPATGQYTFIPNPGFTGTVVTTYTVCNTAVNPIVCSSTSITIIITNNPPKIGIAKAASKVEQDGNGCNLVTFKFTIKNHGTDSIYQVEALDNLDNTFGGQATYTVLSGPVSVNGLLKPNLQFTGSGSNTNLLLSSSRLGAGKADTITIRVRYCVSGSVVIFTNVATASGYNLPVGGIKANDVSNNGIETDPNGNNNPSDPGEDGGTAFGDNPVVFIPQGFSPNNDGVNEKFEIQGIEYYPNAEVSILNRWGNVVFKKSGYDNPNAWDGTANMGVTYGDNKLPEGTYFYIVDLKNGKKALKGYVYLNRSQQ
ncbi:MAG: tandem-95 repeat protein [Bacteroidia bacterium]|nr:tandem-95 repeat protein [Bacteroidia bacterium]